MNMILRTPHPTTIFLLLVFLTFPDASDFLSCHHERCDAELRCLSCLSLWFPSLLVPLSLAFLVCSALPSVACLPLSDINDNQNLKNKYLLSNENQRPGHFSTASMSSLASSPSSCSLSSQVGLSTVTSIQERIMSTPGGEEAIERLKVSLNSCTLSCEALLA